ncbi:protein ULTRAPETALA 2-like [Benincasa hispida]|uniref:protein ULTRAPETALA 2-like n=1 Tax=Benincasa hispida TaxID=102211 RepID=UPI0019005DC6|nr:protein ULTRAPETALA 2-like [Benincasa hispida]
MMRSEENSSNWGMFEEEGVQKMEGFVKGSDFIEVHCGCTSKKYGDSSGKLRISSSGHFFIFCFCSDACNAGKLTPEEFEKHSQREGIRKWKSNIWVSVEGVKVPLWRTCLLKYYKHSENEANWTSAALRRRNFHRDEFIRCFECKKERRFRLRTRDQCQIYHNSIANQRWKCSDRPYDMITCDDDEERESRKSFRGCPRSSKCRGCTSCVCFGCLRCRFLDCHCRACTDFVQNTAP